MMSTDPKLFEAIFLQNWENARHVKNERIWFMNTFSVISAGVLSLQSIQGLAGLQLALLVFMTLFSLIGLLTSLRLKAELEECLGKLQAMTAQVGLNQFLALGQSKGMMRYPKFRWIFPIFYSMAIVGFVSLFLYHLLHFSYPT